jgi:hypothetical protein
MLDQNLSSSFGGTKPTSQPQQTQEQESYLDRMKRLEGGSQPQQPTSTVKAATTTQTTATQPPANSVPTTPVQGDGKIPPPAPQPVAASTPAPTPQPQASTPMPTAPAGLTMVQVGEGWVPSNHPLALQQQQQQQAVAQASAPGATQQSVQQGVQMPGQSLQGMNLGNDPFKTYQASQFNVNTPQLGQLPGSYQGTQFSQFASPDQAAVTAQQNQLLSAILGNPETMNPQVLAQLKEKQKEAALLQEKQGGQLARQFAASRGMTNGAGLAGILSQLSGATGDQIIKSNRDLDLAALERNRADQLAALGMADSVMSGQMGRAGQAFQNTLAGQGAQAQDSRSVAQDAIARAIAGHGADMQSAAFNLQQQAMNADERFKQFGTERSAQDAAIQRVLSQFGINQGVVDADRANRALELQKALGEGGLALDSRRLDMQGSQFDKGFGLDMLRFLEGQRQHDNSTGLGYANLGQQGQNALMNFIQGLL